MRYLGALADACTGASVFAPGALADACKKCCSWLLQSARHGRCRGGPRLLVFTIPGVLKRSDFICLHWKQCFVFLPGLSNDKGSMSCQSLKA